MSSADYEVLSQEDDEIVVRDIATGHVFTFTVPPGMLGERVLSQARFVASDQSSVRPEDIVKFVWNHAQVRMHEAGRIDRIIVR